MIADPVEVLQPDEPDAVSLPAPATTPVTVAEPVAARIVRPEPVAKIDPFSFDSPPEKNGKKAAPKEAAAAVPAAGGGDPFSFDAGSAAATTDDAEEDDGSPPKKGSRTAKSRAKSGSGKKLVLILVGAFVLMCLGCGGASAAVYFLVIEKSKAVISEVEANKAAPPPPPVPEVAGKDAKDAKGKDKAKDPVKPPIKGKDPEPQLVDPRPGIPPKTPKNPPVTPMPPVMTAPAFTLPSAPTGKVELIARKKETIPMDLPATAIRGVRFANSDPPVAAVLWRSVEGFQGAGAKDTVDIYATRTLRRSDRVEFSADGFTGPRAFEVGPGGDRLAIEGPPGKLTVYDFAKKEKSIDGIDPFEGAAGRVLPITAIRFVTPDSVAVFDSAGSVVVFDVNTKQRSTSGPTAPPVDKKSPAVVSDALGDRVYVFANGVVTPVALATGAPAGPAIPVGDPSIVPLGVAVDPTGKRVAVAYRMPNTEPPHALAIVSLAGAKTRTMPLPVDFGIPTGVRFAGSDAAVAVLGNESSALLYDFESNGMVAYLKRPGEPAVQIPDGTSGRYWWIVPDPMDAKKSVFAAIEMPFDDYFKLADTAKGDKKPHYLIPRADGLAK